MSNLHAVLSAIFESGAGEPIVDDAAERLAIELAKHSDPAALEQLLLAYAPLIRKLVGTHRHAGGARTATGMSSHDLDDLRGAALLGFMEAIHAFDPEQHIRLAAVVGGHLADALRATGSAPASALSIGPRTLKRFFGIVREAGGDITAAEELAPAREMTRDTFRAIRSALRDGESYDSLRESDGEHAGVGYASEREATPLHGAADPIRDVEDAVLAQAALRAVDPLEEKVCRLAYGFEDRDPISDAEIADELTMSRATTQRTRTRALDKMRSALGVA
jgi:RNA polymerase sigma factor (sigma-70 family)